MNKQVMGVYNPPRQHWVGDGFPVRSLFSYQTHPKALDPFLLLDFAGPMEFQPADQPRGVGSHPHRGFETVTIVYEGEVSHRDSTGQGGTIGMGDVQWMTAAGGILHEEFHSERFTREGGNFLAMQLWVNLPAKDKMIAPSYQSIVAQTIPEVPLPDDAGVVRVIAGEYSGVRGPAKTHTPMHAWDLHLRAGSNATLLLPDGWNTAVIPVRGSVYINHAEPAHEAQLVVLAREGNRLDIHAETDAIVLLLSGEPINEPVVGYGPFVMNSEKEIRQAIADFNSGKF
jgi:redox-sensitive bicupin YhaK (pirin superfamily)